MCTDEKDYLTAVVLGDENQTVDIGRQQASTQGCAAAYDGEGGYVISWGNSRTGRGLTALKEQKIVFELLLPQGNSDIWINGIYVAGRK